MYKFSFAIHLSKLPYSEILLKSIKLSRETWIFMMENQQNFQEFYTTIPSTTIRTWMFTITIDISPWSHNISRKHAPGKEPAPQFQEGTQKFQPFNNNSKTKTKYKVSKEENQRRPISSYRPVFPFKLINPEETKPLHVAELYKKTGAFGLYYTYNKKIVMWYLFACSCSGKWGLEIVAMGMQGFGGTVRATQKRKMEVEAWFL